MYYRGEGIERDYKLAAKWFRNAADRGFPTSQLNLGVMYFSGQGVERNDAEVVKWITLAAAKGLPEALFRLGRMYEQGAIFKQSTRDAIYWYGKARERGHLDGENQVERLTALSVTKPAPAVIGAKDISAIDTEAKAPDEAPVANEKPVAPPAPQLAKTIPEMPSGSDPTTEPKPEPKLEPKPETRTWRAQIASFRTLPGAKRAWNELQQTFAEEFAGLQPDIVRVDLGPERGVYHRLRVTPLAGRDAAFAFCNRLKSKSSKQACIPLSPER
jgi:hypothetical protein